MILWVAIKHAPLALQRVDNVAKWRFDKCCLWPRALKVPYAIHTEIVITHSCGPWCSLCQYLSSPVKRAASLWNNKHYISYSLDKSRRKVYRSEGRHVLPPECKPGSNESWSYHRIPMRAADVQNAFFYLEAQIEKPMATTWLDRYFPTYMRNFLCLIRRVGVRLDDDYSRISEWQHCSELASTVLVQFCRDFAEENYRDPCLISPCILESQICDLEHSEEIDQISFNIAQETKWGGR